MHIIKNPLPYNSTYFRMSDVTPCLNDDGDIVIFSGKGTSRSSWGEPAVETRVVFRGKSLTAIHVSFYHKHGGGQGWHYFVLEDGQWRKVTWAALSNEDRKTILDRKPTPSWIKSPGKLRKTG